MSAREDLLRFDADPPEPELTPVPALAVDPLSVRLDARTMGDACCEAARAHALAWWLELRPVVGETVGAVLRRAERARRPSAVATGPELARWVLTSAGVLPGGNTR